MAQAEKTYKLGEAAKVTGKLPAFFDEKVKADLVKNGAVLASRGPGTSIPKSALEAIGLTVDDSKLSAPAAVAGGSKSSLEKSIARHEEKVAALMEQLSAERDALRAEQKALADFDKTSERAKAAAERQKERIKAKAVAEREKAKAKAAAEREKALAKAAAEKSKAQAKAAAKREQARKLLEEAEAIEAETV